MVRIRTTPLPCSHASAHTPRPHASFDSLQPPFCLQIHKVLIGALFLLCNETIALDSNDKSSCKLEWDAEESSFWDLMKSHLFKQIVNARDGDRCRKKVIVVVGLGVRN